MVGGEDKCLRLSSDLKNVCYGMHPLHMSMYTHHIQTCMYIVHIHVCTHHINTHRDETIKKEALGRVEKKIA